jgi:hypothetical protein
MKFADAPRRCSVCGQCDRQRGLLYARQVEGDGTLVCHSGRGSQYVSIRYAERMAEAGIVAGTPAGKQPTEAVVQFLAFLRSPVAAAAIRR